MSTPQCNLLCCDKFATFKDVALKMQRTLTNEIHPVFGPDRFPSTCNYASLKPSVQLASRLLELDNVILRIHTMAYGDLYMHGEGEEPEKLVDLAYLDAHARSGTKPKHPKTSRYPKPDREQISDAMRAEVAALLARAVQTVRFEFSEPDTQGSATGAYYGPLTVPETAAGILPRGCKCLIIMSGHTYHKIQTNQHAWKQPQRDDLLEAQFQLANGLLHELAHGLQLMQVGLRDNEFFYKDMEVAEAGYAIEHAAFGGLVKSSDGLLTVRKNEYPHPDKNFQPRIWMLWDWPNGVTQAVYARKRLKMSSTIADIYAETWAWRTKRTFIEELFREKFWIQHAAEGKAMVEVPQDYKWKLFYSKEGFLRPYLSLGESEARVRYLKAENDKALEAQGAQEGQET